MSRVKFNLNEYVFVKLTESGLRELKKQHNDLKAYYPSMGEFKVPDNDEEGFSRFQGWVLIKKFGHLMGNGFDVPFETEIEFENKENHND